MVERINFIERRPFTINYRIVGLLFTGVLVLQSVVYGYQATRIHWLEEKHAVLTVELSELREQQQKMLAVQAPQPVSNGSEQAQLIKALEASPVWSKLLGRVVQVMPANLWLTKIKTHNKDEKSEANAFLIEGKAREPELVAFFVQRLVQSGFFSHVLLTSSILDKPGVGAVFNFSINADVSPGGSF